MPLKDAETAHHKVMEPGARGKIAADPVIYFRFSSSIDDLLERSNGSAPTRARPLM